MNDGTILTPLYNIGDVLIIRKDFTYEIDGGTKHCVPPMGKFKGKIVTISRVIKKMNRIVYEIKEDGGTLLWPEYLFERKDAKKKKVFLGGTCNNSTWRDLLISMLKIGYFNPVVDDWTPECMVEECKQREECDYCLYVITPKMHGVFSIAEVVDDSNKRPEKTLFCFLEEDDGLTFDNDEIKSLRAVAIMVIENGGKVFQNLDSIAIWLNNRVYKSYKSE